MRLELTCDASEASDGKGPLRVRLLVVNDSYEPVIIDRGLLFGPQPAHGDPPLISSEPPPEGADHNRLTLNPWTVYGRERRFGYRPGGLTFHGYLLSGPTDTLLPTGPGDDDALWAAAPPLEVRLDDDDNGEDAPLR